MPILPPSHAAPPRLRPALAVAGAALALACSTPLGAQDAGGPEADATTCRPLTLEDCDRWNAIRSPRLSRSGAWMAWRLAPADGDDGVAVVASTSGDARHRVERGDDARVTAGDRHAVCLVRPARADLRAAEEEDAKDAEKPKAALAIVSLGDGSVTTVERVRSYAVPEERGGWVAYLREEPLPADDDGTDADDAEPAEEEGPTEPPPAEAEEEESDEEVERDHWKDHDDGTELVLRDLATGVERTFEHVVSYEFSKDGRTLAFATRTEDEGGDGLYLVEVGAGAPPRPLLEGEGRYRSVAFSEDGEAVVFLSDTADWDAEEHPDFALYHARTAGDGAADVLVDAGTPGVPGGWRVSEHRAPRFSRSGSRVLLGTAPRPEPEPEELPEDERVELDVWSWDDPDLQTVQLVRLDDERERSYLAVAHLGRDAPGIVQVGTEEQPDVTLPGEGDAPRALATFDEPYRLRRQWDPGRYADVWVVDVGTGARRRVLRGERGRFSIDPGGRWITWWDAPEETWRAVDAEEALAGETEVVDLTGHLDVVFANERHDTPSPRRSYGRGGWVGSRADDGTYVTTELLVYDAHDVWAIDPEAPERARCITRGAGREADLRLRVIDLDDEEPVHDPAAPALLSMLDLATKEAGFWRARLDGAEPPRELLRDAKSFGRPVRADEGDVLRLTREDYREFPDLWVADSDLADLWRVSDANPQQSEFRWGRTEPVEWRGADGTPLEGFVCVPDDFDPSHRYPLVVYFYERNAENLFEHWDPVPHRSIVRFPYYTSRGYVVFVPDVVYREGQPGRSAHDCVVSGVLDLVDRGFVDPERVGVQGHSWGGYQIAWLVTRTDLFRCAIAGAPVSNMTSAYGGIRWGSGLSRQFQYERSQSRIGASLWERPLHYIENSPLFQADRVSTPLLILHNDEDGAVPWYQGIELFVALRRLGKECWLLNYNGEKHGLTKYAHKRDYARRMSQFLDHHLLDAPAPRWLTEGIPAIRKGRDLGFEPAAAAERPDGGEEVDR